MLKSSVGRKLLITALALTAVGCTPGGGSSTGSTSPAPGASSPVQTSSSAPTSPTPSASAAPTAPAPSFDGDLKLITKAVVTRKELGSSWKQYGKLVTTRSGGAGPCPKAVNFGEKIPFVVGVQRTYINKNQDVVAFNVATLPDDDVSELKLAYARTFKQCHEFRDSQGTYFVDVPDKKKIKVRGEEVLFQLLGRAYTDKAHTRLAYYSMQLVTRKGRVVVFTEWAFSGSSVDDGRKKLVAFNDRQVKKVSQVL